MSILDKLFVDEEDYLREKKEKIIRDLQSFRDTTAFRFLVLKKYSDYSKKPIKIICSGIGSPFEKDNLKKILDAIRKKTKNIGEFILIFGTGEKVYYITWYYHGFPKTEEESWQKQNVELTGEEIKIFCNAAKLFKDLMM